MTIIGKYKICDCEHAGDILAAKSFLKSVSTDINIDNVYWDRKDCGDAYIIFSFSDKNFIEIYNKINAVYNADINDYIDYSKESFKNISPSQYNTFKEKLKKNKLLFDNNFISVSLFFEQTKKFTNETIINKALSVLGKNAVIDCFTIRKCGEETFVFVLFKVPNKNINSKRLETFGNYCLGNKGWLKKNNIYGELNVNSVLYNKENDGKFLFDLINKISKHEKLIYQTKNYYYKKEIEVDFNDYFKNELISETIQKDGEIYYLKN